VNGTKGVTAPNSDDLNPIRSSIFPNDKSNEFLDIPRMRPEALKTSSAEHNAGKKPFDIIASYNYH
jgi:hypothetical protein